MRLWYLSHRRPAKAQVSLRIHSVSPKPSLIVHMKYGGRWRVRPKIRHLALLDGCTWAFEEWVYGEGKNTIISWAGSFVFCAFWKLLTPTWGHITCLYHRCVPSSMTHYKNLEWLWGADWKFRQEGNCSAFLQRLYLLLNMCYFINFTLK